MNTETHHLPTTLDTDEVWVVAPKGFRPRAWVEMLRDFDVAYGLDPHLVDELVVDHEDMLSIEASLLDPALERSQDRMALFWDLMDRVSELGLELCCHKEFPTQYPAWWTQIEDYCKGRSIPLHLM